jgi:hypothetical protein
MAKQIGPEPQRDLIRLRDLLHTSYRIQQSAAARLDELGTEPPESETCWAVMSLGLDFERRIDAEYCALAGLEADHGC